jgi:1,4-dihydroxy-2-naphthoate octaprenyltransferase
VLGKPAATKLFVVFPCVVYMLIILGIVLNLLPAYSAMVFTTIPMIIQANKKIKKSLDDMIQFSQIMRTTVMYSRVTGALFVISIVIATINS